MQSFNKLSSFGDDTLSACIQAEAKVMDNINNASDKDKYFEDNTFLSKIAENLNNIGKATQSRQKKQRSCTVKAKSNRANPKCKETNTNHGTKSRFVNSNMLDITKVKSTNFLKKSSSALSADKENVNAKSTVGNAPSHIDTLHLQCNNSELSSNNSNIKDHASHNIANDAESAKLSSSDASISREEKSSVLNPSFSIIPSQDRYKLASWGLPPNILQKYEARGITDMFPWQVECLSNHKVMQEKRNLVYSAPTSAGKTLVAEILMIKTILERQRKVIFILPFVSVVREKMYYFQDLLSDSGIRVDGFMGGIAPPGGFAATHVAIATIEKANSLVNRLMEENELINLGAVVIDELHLLGDPNRGYLLELLLTKLKYMTSRNEHIDIQMIGMSATLPNLPLLAEWLDAELYKTDFRPVPLNEQCKIGKTIYDNKLRHVRNLTPMPELTTDTDDVLHLCIETISDGYSVLIFCPTKSWCEKLAEQLAAAICKLGREDTELGKTLRQQLDTALISETLEQLRRSPSGLDSVLRNTVSFGTAFHHAGLTMDERDIIEGSFRSGSLRVLVATSTLSSGVNLPARRVIVRSPMFAGRLLDSLTYRQMIGRAGRMGKDTAGESILICKVNEQKAAQTLLSATLEPIESCLEDSGPLIRALLEAIASEVVYTPADLRLYIKCTLVSLSNPHDSQDPSNQAIKFLIDNEFLLLQNTEEGHRWVATAFGKACLAASVPPREGLFLLEELQKARRCFVLDTELHVVYLVTPLTSGNQIGTIDWMTFMELWKRLPDSERRVGQLVGIEERFLTSAIKGIVRPGKSLSVHKRFYTALALHDLVREVPLNAVCQKYGCCRGVLQSLQQSASTFAGMVTQFCKQLGWDCMELLVSQFQVRLQFGVCRELLDLLRLPMLNGLRARSLYKHGITNVADLAVANELDVERALYTALPFESEKEQDGERESEALKRNKMRTVFVTGKDGLTPHEAAVMLVQEARALLQNELGLQDMSWKPHEQSIVPNVSKTEGSLSASAQAESKADSNGKDSSTNAAVEDNSSDALTNSLNKDNLENQSSGVDLNVEKDNGDSGDNRDNVAGEEKSECTKLNDQLLRMEMPDSSSMVEQQMREIDSSRLTDQLLEIHIPDFADSAASKTSADVFDDSSPNMVQASRQRRNSQSLISLNGMKLDRTQNLTVKHSIVETESAGNISGIPKKKTKIAENPAITRAPSFDSDKPLSRSPSLFDDSLNLDTQMFNALEQNIVGSFDFSEFEDSRLAKQEAAPWNTRNSGSKTAGSAKNETQRAEDKISDKTVLISTNTYAKNSVLSWQDDSWNETNKIAEKLDRMKSRDATAEPRIKNVKNTSTQHTVGTTKSNAKPSAKAKRYERPEHVLDNLSKVSKTRRFKDAARAESPVASVITVTRSRVSSLGSNKSDSDDIVIPSQDMSSPATSIKMRSRLNSERKGKTYTPRTTGAMPSKTFASGISSTIDIQKCKIKPKLRDILPQKLLSSENRSTESIISNSDEDTPEKAPRTAQVPKTDPRKSVEEPETLSGPSAPMSGVIEATSWRTLNIVKVGSDRGTFNLFKRELMQKRSIALALNCELYKSEANRIGSKVIGSANPDRRGSKKLDNYVHNDRKLSGAAIAWESNIAYYLSFTNDQDLKVSAKEQMKLLRELLCNVILDVKCFATKETFKTLYECCGIAATCNFLDPKVASWLYDGGICDKTFNDMVRAYFPHGSFINKKIGTCYDVGPGLNVKSPIPGEFRASAEAVLTCHATDSLLDKLEELNPTVMYTLRDVEMRTVVLLARMELTGLGVCLKSLQDLSSVIRDEMASLEERAFAFAGKRFNFSSSRQVGEVLGLYKGKKISVNKAVLGQSDHPLSSLVMSWRKLNATQSNIVYPILSQAQFGPRIHGNCVTATTTGRVSMHEPNLQNVPKDFGSEDNSFTISVRMAFVPTVGNVMLSADYCQLELRILAHFSNDPTLCDIMRRPGDIFRSIAAGWSHVSEDQVDDSMRQRAKQLCYGMIYGMGTKTLAESLSVDEIRAKEFLESFMNAYPGISRWMNSALDEARTNGYVTTILERRRMLPGLSSANAAEKSQAERQAINTKVQGSAADIAKKAMVNIDERMRYEFPASAIVMPYLSSTRKLRSNSREPLQRGGYLVLQLHDELLYEVNIKDLREVATIVKESMEQVCQLAVPLPVKLRVGPAWGDLSEYNL